MTKYEDYDFTNPHDTYRMELDQALKAVPTDEPRMLMHVMEMAWMRGHHAGSELGHTEHANPFKLPAKDHTKFSPEDLDKMYPKG